MPPAGWIRLSSCAARLALRRRGRSTRRKQAHQGVEPAHGLGSLSRQVVVALGQQPQGGHVVFLADGTQPGMAQRRAGGRALPARLRALAPEPPHISGVSPLEA